MNKPKKLLKAKTGFFSWVGKGNALIFAFTSVFFAVFGILWAASFFWPNSDLVNYNAFYTVLFAVIICAFLFCVLTLAKRLPEHCFIKRHTALCVAVLLICCLPLQCILFFNVYYQPGWDVSILTESGYWLAMNMGMPTNYYDYFASYPNNITLLMVWAYFFKFLIQFFHFYDYLFAAVMLSAVLTNLALFEVYRISSRHFGRRGALLALCLGIPLLAFAPWMTNPYSDTMTILFPVLILDLLDMAVNAQSNKKKLALSLIAGICAGVGVMIKPTVIIILIAVGLGLLICVQGKKSLISLAAVVLCAALSSAAVSGIISKFNMKVLENTGISEEYVNQISYPFTHFLMMGMQKQVSGFNAERYQYGKWYAEDVMTSFAQKGQQAKIKVNLQVIKERLTEFGAGGYIRFLFDKARWVLGDGTMYFGGEGGEAIECFQNTDFARAIQAVYWRGGKYYIALTHFLQGIWMAVMALCCLSALWQKGNRPKPQTVVLQMAVAGIVLFILLFEGRSRYLINYLPIFLILASCGLLSLSKINFKKIIKLK